MTKESLAALLSYAGIHVPEETEEGVVAFPGGGHTLVSREGLQEALALGGNHRSPGRSPVGRPCGNRGG